MVERLNYHYCHEFNLHTKPTCKTLTSVWGGVSYSSALWTDGPKLIRPTIIIITNLHDRTVNNCLMMNALNIPLYCWDKPQPSIWRRRGKKQKSIYTCDNDYTSAHVLYSLAQTPAPQVSAPQCFQCFLLGLHSAEGYPVYYLKFPIIIIIIIILWPRCTS